MIELLQGPSVSGISDPQPEFGWIVHSSAKNDSQTAYRILVEDMWDSGKVKSSESINIEYRGKDLSPGKTYHWKVKTWTAENGESQWSKPQAFTTSTEMGTYSTPGYPLVKTIVDPVELIKKDDGHYFIDFGRAAAGTVRISITSPADGQTITFHLGEKTSGKHTVVRQPGGSIRYRKICLDPSSSDQTHTYELTIPPDDRNTGKRTIKMPEEIGEVLPFRYCEVVNFPGELKKSDIRQITVHYPFDDNASSFTSSSETLNKIWEMCRYSIKATSYCGLYIDGDRDRFPREADSYINQISHYCVDREYTLARQTHEFMLTHTSQWTEWILHSVIMAWTDYLYTGNIESIRAHYEDLRHKTLTALAREDGLISTRTGRVDDDLRKAVHYYEGAHVKGRNLVDIVDWPRGERDGYDFRDYNTVVNAFHYRALVLMARMAAATGKRDDAAEFRKRADQVYESFNRVFWDGETGRYVDGEESAHSSLHANMFPLALGLVPEERRESVADFVASRGMACSVYGAQYLLLGA